MGWKASVIIIRPQATVPAKQLLESLGFTNVVSAEPEPFEIAIYPRDERIFVGNYRVCTILSSDTLTMDIFSYADNPLEQKLVTLFPNSEICAITLHSAMNLWGYIVIKNGLRIRQRLGDSDGVTILDIGDPLKEEMELLSQSEIGEDGQRVYHLKRMSSDSLTEDQVGENFVFELFRRYTGEPLDKNDNLLFETSFEGFNYEWPAIELSTAVQAENKSSGKTHWWKFW